MDHKHKYKMQSYKLLEDNIQVNLGELKYDNNFLDRTTKA